MSTEPVYIYINRIGSKRDLLRPAEEVNKTKTPLHFTNFTKETPA